MKKNIRYIDGKKIFLRPFLKSDLTKEYLRNINSKLNNFLETGKLPISDIDLENYYSTNLKSKNSILFAVCDRKSEKHIGNCSVINIDWINRRCSYGRLIWTNNKRLSGSGSEVLKLIQKYVFEELNLNSIFTGVVASNKASIKSNLKCGMKLTGKFEQSFFKNNKYYDSLLFSLTKKQYQKLRNER
jgi:RimJ/RimL family protein N-acetyltransferase